MCRIQASRDRYIKNRMFAPPGASGGLSPQARTLPRLEPYLEAYIEAAGIASDGKGLSQLARTFPFETALISYHYFSISQAD